METIKPLLRRVKRELLKVFPQYHIPRPFFPASSNDLGKVLLITCAPGFDQDSPKAASLMRVGFARGWAETCGPAKLIPVSKLMDEIELFDNPAVLMSEFEFVDWSYADLRRLRNVDLFVWVGVHPLMYPKLENHVPLLDQAYAEMSLRAYGPIVAAEPKFVWNAVGKASGEWYQGWRDDGFQWETIYPAADPHRYFPDPAPDKYGHIKMAYVGGYWAEKGQGLDLYLRPWEDILHPFGHNRWPYKHYTGPIDDVGERQLYSSAGLIPLLTGPYGWLIAEITERYLKAPACAAFCIADHNPALREVFTEDEMLQAENPEHFHILVKEVLDGKFDRNSWKKKGYRAVKARHLYTHRAIQIKEALEKSNMKV